MSGNYIINGQHLKARKHQRMLDKFFAREDFENSVRNFTAVEFFYDDSFDDYFVHPIITAKLELGQSYANNFRTIVEDVYRDRRNITTVIL